MQSEPLTFNPGIIGAAHPGNGSIRVQFIRNNRARRYILRLREDGSIRVTVPRRGTLDAAEQFLRRSTDWLQAQRQLRALRGTDWQIGGSVYLDGEQVRIELVAPDRIRLGQRILTANLNLPLRPQIERSLWRWAAGEMPLRVRMLAEQHGFTFARVSVRNQRSRWGSCSTRGTISLNWRLIQAPSHVRDYIILHELCHTRHMNHSRRFWELVRLVCPEFKMSERWLRENSRLLR